MYIFFAPLGQRTFAANNYGNIQLRPLHFIVRRPCLTKVVNKQTHAHYRSSLNKLNLKALIAAHIDRDSAIIAIVIIDDAYDNNG